ncbi:hypothetical protein Anas_12381 [Armadillidium nasatum]|uniref:Uncharacterized protein n=1 Tax=Armadillidium nasatum TaxID=96803 RepID=A0A5N5T238_9CRUS|nr:hypothetical protein Anas_12381 [Armadillidium nasatum]
MNKKNSVGMENRSLTSSNSLNEPKIYDNFSVEFSISNERSFEDKCLTTFNRSSNAAYFEKSQNLEFLKTKKGKEYKKILAHHYFTLGIK